jgi:iron(III) transport system permease protein
MLVAVATLYAALGLGPLLWTFGDALWERSGELGSLALTSSTWAALGRSTALGGLSALGASLLAAPLAFITGKTDLRERHFVSALALLPLALPPYNVALALRSFLPGEPLVATSLVLTLALYPIPFLFLRAALSSVDPALEEAGVLARGRMMTLRHVTEPLIRPWAVAAAGLVFLLGLGEFGAPAYLGLPVYSGQIALRFAATYDAAGAAVASLPLLGAVLVVLAAESAALRRVEVFAGRLRPALVFELGRLRYPARVLGLGIVLLSPGLPLLLTVLQVDLPGIRRALPMAIRPALTSLLVAIAGSLTALVVALALALLVRREIRVFRITSLAFFVMPGAILGVGLIGFWNHPALPRLYGTVGLVVLAVVLRYTLLAERTIDAELRNVPEAQEQVARLAGRGESAIALRILGPQLATPIAAGAVLFVLFALRDLDTVVTIYPPGGETLTVRLYTVLANSPRGLQAALSLAQTALTLPVVLLLLLTLRKSRWLF